MSLAAGTRMGNEVDAVNAAALPAEPVPGSSVEPSPVCPEVNDVVEVDAPPTPPALEPVVIDGDPTALGSAFHAAAQWMVETGSDTVPSGRLAALCCTWGCTAAQCKRLAAALERWQGSAVRHEALSWPQVRAEVPFFAPGTREYAAYGTYAEGAIDLLCTDPANSTHALVIDYKTGGTPDETPDELQTKHERQARIYADALHASGYEHITCRFVRVEQPDPVNPDQPQVVSYEL